MRHTADDAAGQRDAADIAEHLLAAIQMSGHPWNDHAVKYAIHVLSDYEPAMACAACIEAAKASRGRLCIADIIAQLPLRPQDWPSAEEAFASVPKTEDASAIVCNEQMMAWGGVADLYHDGDRYGARTAFIKSYERMVAAARGRGERPRQWLSGATGADRASSDADAVNGAIARRALPGAQPRLAIEHARAQRPPQHTGFLRLREVLDEYARSEHGVRDFRTLGNANAAPRSIDDRNAFMDRELEKLSRLILGRP